MQALMMSCKRCAVRSKPVIVWTGLCAISLGIWHSSTTYSAKHMQFADAQLALRPCCGFDPAVSLADLASLVILQSAFGKLPQLLPTTAGAELPAQVLAPR